MNNHDESTMRLNSLLFSTLELLRTEIRPKFSDWKAADDWLFAELGFTKDELAQIYDGRGIMYYDASAVDEKNQYNSLPAYLFEDNRSHDRLRHPGDANSADFCNWYEYYSIDEKGKSRHEDRIYKFSVHGTPLKDLESIKAQIYHDFCRRNPDREVIVLSLERSDMSARSRMNDAIQKYEKDHKAIKVFPAYTEIFADEKYSDTTNGNRINGSKLRQYLADDMILEFDSAKECMDYFNTYDSQHFKTVDEMKAYQGNYGFGVGEKWYHICFDEALDVLEKSSLDEKIHSASFRSGNSVTLDTKVRNTENRSSEL